MKTKRLNRRDFHHLTKNTGILAAELMEAYKQFNKQDPRRTFIDFVRWIDPRVPASREAYKLNATYQRCDHLRRLYAAARWTGGRDA